MHNKVRIQIFLTILILSVIPLVATYFLLNDILNTSLDLGFNENVKTILIDSQENLKQLKKYDPANQNKYKEKFDKIQSSRAVYDDLPFVKKNLGKSLFAYWAAGFSVAFLLALAAAYLLGRSISKRYTKTLNDLMRAQEKVTYLNEIGLWQNIARKLAHEIKNPLTPIEMMVTSLKKAYSTKNKDEFGNYLDEVNQIVSDEIRSLKQMVQSFSAFGKLPQVNLKPADLNLFVGEYIASHEKLWTEAEIELSSKLPQTDAKVDLDAALFKQVFTNLIKNAIEANPGLKVKINIGLDMDDEFYTIKVFNQGKAIPEEVRSKIFELYFSTKKTGDNMGVGLAVVRKIVLEHSGEIECLPVDGGAAFLIKMPKKDSVSG